MSWRMTYRSVTYGAPADAWRFDGSSGAVLEGLVGNTYKLNDVPRIAADGSVHGDAFRDVRLVRVLLVSRAASVSAALTLADTLQIDWAPDSAQTVLTFNIEGHIYNLLGSPADCQVNLNDLKSRLVRALVAFTVHNG